MARLKIHGRFKHMTDSTFRDPKTLTDRSFDKSGEKSVIQAPLLTAMTEIATASGVKMPAHTDGSDMLLTLGVESALSPETVLTVSNLLASLYEANEALIKSDEQKR